jgi:hypothetical protein
MKTVLLFLFLQIMLFAEDIYLKNGTIYLNAKIIDRNETYITILINEGKSNIALSEIQNIVDTPYNPSIAGSVKQGKMIINEIETKSDPHIIKVSQKHFLIVTALAGLVSWDMFSEASHLPKGDDKTRKTVIGVISGVACVTALYFSFENIEVNVKPYQLEATYNF